MQDLNCKKESHVAIVTLDGPPKDQAEVGYLGTRLADQCAELSLDNDIRVLVLIGSRDDSFSMGEALSKGVTRACIDPPTGPLGITETFSDFHQPIVAGLPGEVSGQGLELALACDMRIAAEGCHLSLPHIKKGLIPWEGGTQRLLRVVGMTKALEMVLTGERIDAEEAHRIGLVNKVVPPSQLHEEVMNTARKMANASPISLAYAKEAIHKGMDLTLSQGLRLEADLYYLIHTTRDREEGIRAFQEKREAQFEGE